MDFLNSFLDNFDVWIVGIVLCSGFFQKIYLKSFTLSKSNDSALKTLLVSGVVSALYIFLLKDPEKANNWTKFLVSYFAATSLYELLIVPFIQMIKKRTGQE